MNTSCWRNICFSVVVSIFLFEISYAQKADRFQNQRAKENYSYLRDSTALEFPSSLKFIPIGKQGISYLSVGGSYRTRFEGLSNQNWSAANDQYFYSQRITLHLDACLGKYFRFFGELQHGYRTGGTAFLESDELDVHQAFIQLNSKNSKLFLRLGRQEMKYGVGRLFDFSLGPNIRRTFDIGKLTYTNKSTQVDFFYGKDVELNFEAFDNRSNIFQNSTSNSKIWGVYSQFSLFPNNGEADNTELYYLGIESPSNGYNDVRGEETRHSIGIRKYGNGWSGFTYNTELIYQFGNIGDNTISAYNIEVDWQYRFTTKWRPTIGLKLDWSSGDRESEDGKINSFNPMYVNPAIYSLAVVNTPINLLSYHPSITMFPVRKMMIELEFAFFNRTSLNDGLYSPPNRQVRPANGLSARHIGNTLGLFFVYNYSKHLSFNIRSSYFMTGSFIEQSGESENILQVAPTLQFTF